jgi:hypothetical protein
MPLEPLSLPMTPSVLETVAPAATTSAPAPELPTTRLPVLAHVEPGPVTVAMESANKV